MSQRSFKKNQVVWAKLKGYPWWPSSVQSVSGQDVVVNFLGENSHATIRSDQVFDFKESYGQFIKGVSDRKKKLKAAVDIAMRISEGKTTYEEERRTMERKYLMEEDDDEDTEDRGSKKKKNADENDGDDSSAPATAAAVANNNHADNSNSNLKNASSSGAGVAAPTVITKSRSTRRNQMKAAEDEVVAVGVVTGKKKKDNDNTQEKNLKDKKIVPGNAHDIGMEISEKEHQKMNEDDHDDDYPQSTAENHINNSNKIDNQGDNNIIEEEKMTEKDGFPLNEESEKDNNQINNTNGMHKESNDQIVQNVNEKEILDQQDLRKRKVSEVSQEEDDEEHVMELEKKTTKRDKKGANNSKATNSSIGKDLNEPNGVVLSHSGRPQRTKRKNGLQMQYLSEQPFKKQHVNNNNTTSSNNSNSQSSLVKSLEGITHAIAAEKAAPTGNYSKLLKDLDAVCTSYEHSQIKVIDIIKTGIGRTLASIHCAIIGCFKSPELNGIAQKIMDILDGIREKVLIETLGETIAQHPLFLKASDVAHSTKKLDSSSYYHKSQHSSSSLSQQQQVDEDKKHKEKQLRQKVCKKINDLLIAHYAYDKEKAWKLGVGLEKKIKVAQPELSYEYRNNVKGVIRMIKSKELTMEQLETSSVDELIQMIKLENIQADLKSSGVHFEKGAINNQDDE